MRARHPDISSPIYLVTPGNFKEVEGLKRFSRTQTEYTLHPQDRFLKTSAIKYAVSSHLQLALTSSM